VTRLENIIVTRLENVIVTKLRAGLSVIEYRQEQEIFPSPKYPNRLWCQSNFLLDGYQDSILVCDAARTWGWPLISIEFRGYEWVELNPHSSYMPSWPVFLIILKTNEQHHGLLVGTYIRTETNKSPVRKSDYTVYIYIHLEHWFVGTTPNEALMLYKLSEWLWQVNKENYGVRKMYFKVLLYQVPWGQQEGHGNTTWQVRNWFISFSLSILENHDVVPVIRNDIQIKHPSRCNNQS
jgi:hypothetical protein